ncbi:TIGR04086 family membrane protein [Clostridium vincentii]|uniref:TIGR04086 family membrane protein n=1 Tax=Clostridium vincentii TaxID=52704 RepID=A0A2T0BBL0_9CLOT|nr:TIGR04086 family membrane protein [Clostridium vincentii]PRR81223.1 hypothetical protein CLVI_26350 [Clostridium vincentii]
MERRKFVKNIFKGAIGAMILSGILLLILSIIMINFDISKGIYSVVYRIIVIGSLVVGGVATAKGNEQKGWLSGALVGVLFFLGAYVVGALVSGDWSFNGGIAYGLIEYVIIAGIAGILGVNL